MSKLAPFPTGKGWLPKDAVADAMPDISDDAECIIIYRNKKNHRASWRAANLTNAETVFILHETINSITNRCHECKCEQLCE